MWIKIVDKEIKELYEEEKEDLEKGIVKKIEKEGVEYDIGEYRDEN